MLPVRPSEEVSIISGPFSGVHGTVVKIVKPDRAVVAVQVNRREMLVELDCEMMKRTTESEIPRP